MDLETVVRNAVEVKRSREFAESNQLSLGEITTKAESLRKVLGNDALVFLDGGDTPGKLHSWRGVYAELALEYYESGHGLPLSVFLDDLNDANGKTYQGYKGGDFRMNRLTPVWVAHRGESGGCLAVVGVERSASGGVVIKTERKELN